jgi:hypothetical protein
MGIEENIAPGKILYLNVYMPLDDRPRNKYFVVVSGDESPLLLKINTSGVQTELGKRFNEYQFRIKKSVYKFLEHDSYLDCGTVWKSLLTRDEIIKQLTKDPSRVKGTLLADHKNEVVRYTNKSRSISPQHKRIIAEELRK